MSYSLPWSELLSSLGLPLSLVVLYLGAVIFLAEGLNRIISADAELTRKIVHIGAGNVILFAWWFNIPAWMGIGAAIIAAGTALVSYFVPILPSINSVGRKSLGTFFYAVSIGILIAWFWSIDQPQYAAIGVLVMTWGDGMAAIIGQQFGKHHYQVLGITKSWEGSLAMAVVSFLISSLILGIVGENLGQICLISLAIATVATSLEAFSKLGVDNFTVPLGSAALGFFLGKILF